MSTAQSILIVDDKPQNLFALEKTLCQLHVSVVKAQGGNEALAATLSHDFALAVLDVQMPEMNGFELAALMRGDERTRHIPIIFLTAAYAAEDSVFQGYEAGAVDYIVKPFNARVLLAKVGVFLELDRQRVELARHRQHLEDLVRSKTNDLRRSAERNSFTIATAMDGFWEVSPAGRLLDVNEAYVAMSGYCRAELLSMSIADLEAGETPEDTQKHMARIVEQGHDRFETRHRRKDGTVFDAEASVQYGSLGGECQFVAFIRDISQRKRAEQSLRLSAEKWSATFDAMSEVVSVVSGSQEILEINKAGCESLRTPKSQIVGRKCYEVFHGTASPVAACPCTLAALTNEPVKTRHEQDGRTYELSASPLRDSQGDQVAFVNVMADITAEVAANTERAKLEQQLFQAQKMEAIGRLAGGVAHDFNNLLSAILSFGTFVKEALSPTDPAFADISEVLGAAQRATSLTRQLLAFSRRQIVEPRVIDPSDTVSATEKMLRRLLGEDIELHSALSADVGRVRIDPGQIEQVLMNLAVNAGDAMPEGGRLTIEVRNVTLDQEYTAHHAGAISGDYVMLAVSDTGCGMSDEVREHVFEPFFTTKERGKGTGLGLATCYGIVKQAGGYISLDTKLGRGASFKIYLPRVADQVEAPQPVATAPGRGSETVLLVEDERAVRAVAVRALRARGYTVLDAETGGDALLQCERHCGLIHLLLTDVVMPSMSGRELARRLTQLRPDLRVLYMSGYTDDAIVHHGVLEAGLHFIQKPFLPDALARKVREVLDSPRASAVQGQALPSTE